MSTTTTEQIQREAPEIEAIRLALLQDAQQLAAQPINLPDYQVSGLSPLQQQANRLAQQGVGTFQPFLNQAATTTGLGRSAVGEGFGTTRGALSKVANAAQNVGGGFAPVAAGELAAASGLGTIAGGQAQAMGGLDTLASGVQGLDPQAYQAFFDPYTTDVIQQAEQDISRQGLIQQNALNAQAAAAGAFGGSRQGIQNTELGRNVLEQQARTAAQLRQAGFGQAQQLAQNRAQQLGQFGVGQFQGAQTLGQLGQGQFQGAQTLGQLGAQRGTLGTQIGQLGATEADIGRTQGALGQSYGQLGQTFGQLGEAQSALQSRDLQNLSGLGATELQQNQALLDARRQNVMQRQFEPYQRVSFLQDIQSRTPSAQQTLTTATSPGVSPFQQVAGLGIAGLSAAAGAKNLGIF
tara:strand:+ start:2062 stop:3285 length:1224 start_codon:yes stop_codon:yes gene_type:complete